MTYSKQIAALAGPLLLAMGAGLILNRDMFPAMAEQIAANPGFIFLTGILSLLAGLAIVRVHNTWSGGWPLIITLLGWLAVAGGLVRILLPGMAAPIVAAVEPSAGLIATTGGLMALLGTFLSVKGYAAD